MQAGVQADGRSGVARTAEIDLGALGRALWRKQLLIAGLTLLAAAIAFAAVSLITPRYKSEARVLIETRENIFLRPDAERSTERSTTVDQEAMTSQVQLVLSRDLARRVIKKDDILDEKNVSIIRELLTYIAEYPALTTYCIELISIAKNLERVGDLATNICEDTIFIAEARWVKHHASELP